MIILWDKRIDWLIVVSWYNWMYVWMTGYNYRLVPLHSSTYKSLSLDRGVQATAWLGFPPVYRSCGCTAHTGIPLIPVYRSTGIPFMPVYRSYRYIIHAGISFMPLYRSYRYIVHAGISFMPGYQSYMYIVYRSYRYTVHTGIQFISVYHSYRYTVKKEQISRYTFMQYGIPVHIRVYAGISGIKNYYSIENSKLDRPRSSPTVN